MILFSNNASTSLAAACTASDTYVDVLPGTAVLFPVPSTSAEYFMITLVNPSNGNLEICKVTSVFGDRFNVTRAQEGTVAMAFPQNTIVENRLTAGSLQQLLNDISADISTAGRIRIASLAEAILGVVADAAITPLTLKGWADGHLINTSTPLAGGGSIHNNLTLSINAAGAATASTAGAPGSVVYAADNAADTVRNQAATPAHVAAKIGSTAQIKAYGRIAANGSILRASGVASAIWSGFECTITLNTAQPNVNYVVIISPTGGSELAWMYPTNTSTTQFKVRTANTSGSGFAAIFSFVVLY